MSTDAKNTDKVVENTATTETTTVETTATETATEKVQPKINKQLVNKDILLERLQKNIYGSLKPKTLFVSAIRKVRSSKEDVMAFEVEYLEKIERVRQAEKGVSLSVLINSEHDDRFKQNQNVKRAWAVFLGLEALQNAIGKLTEDNINTLKSMEERGDDRLAVMMLQKPITVAENRYQAHIVVTELLESQVEEARLSKSQRASFEHENSFMMNKDGEFIVCATTGERVRQITEIRAFNVNEDISTVHTYVENKTIESEFNKTPGSNNKVVGKDLTEEEALRLLVGEE